MDSSDMDMLVAKLSDATNALRMSRAYAESLEKEVADLRDQIGKLKDINERDMQSLCKRLEETEQALLSETHLAESRLLKIRKLRKKLRKSGASRVDGPITEGSALDRVHEFISTVNERIQNIEDQLEDLGGALNVFDDRIDALGNAPNLDTGILIDRMARLEHKFHIMATGMYTIRQLINPCS